MTLRAPVHDTRRRDLWWLEAEAAGYPVVRPRDREARTRKENIDMAEARDKARNSAQGAKGKAKEAAGRATGNDRLRAKGKTDQAKSKVKKAGERVKDRFR
jgi:uncharacterized protein YjbJ (UPF0337 family)